MEHFSLGTRGDFSWTDYLHSTREKVMQRFKSPEQAQQFLSSFGPIHEHLKPRRHLMKATDYRNLMVKRFQIWEDVTAVTGCKNK